MAIKLIPQDVETLKLAYAERRLEYDCLRDAKRWAGAIHLSGVLVEVAFKIIIGKHLGIHKLPDLFKVHDLELLRYCSGLEAEMAGKPDLHRNFMTINSTWTIDLRYRGAGSQASAESIHVALDDTPDGLLTFLCARY